MKKKLTKILILGMIFGILAGPIVNLSGPEDPPAVGNNIIQRI